MSDNKKPSMGKTGSMKVDRFCEGGDRLTINECIKRQPPVKCRCTMKQALSRCYYGAIDIAIGTMYRLFDIFVEVLCFTIIVVAVSSVFWLLLSLFY